MNVIFKGTKDGVTVLFDPEAPFDILCSQLEKKVEEAGRFFDNVKTSMAFKGRTFTEAEEEQLLKIITSNTSMDITFVKTENNEVKELSELLTKEMAQAIVDGDYEWMINSGEPLIQELYTKIKNQGLRPKTIVDYEREPFVFSAGNVRVTLDYNIRTGIACTDFLNPDCVTVPAGETVILEVKWDEYLPDIIRDIVQLPSCRTGNYSKYAVCRIYG